MPVGFTPGDGRASVSETGQDRPPLRAKDSDRDAVIDALNGAFVEGQLDQTEHQRRVDLALAARPSGRWRR